MRKIVLSLEYGAYPIWVYDNDNIVDYNDIPDEWEEDKSLDLNDIKAKLDELQNLYQSAFINNETTFQFIGFQGDKDKMNRMDKLLNEIREFIIKHLSDGYTFEDGVIIHNELKGF